MDKVLRDNVGQFVKGGASPRRLNLDFNEVKRLYSLYNTVEAVAKKLHCSSTAIRNCLKRNCYKLNNKLGVGKTSKNTLDIDIVYITKLYEHFGNADSVAKVIGCSRPTIVNRLREGNVKIVNTGKFKKGQKAFNEGMNGSDSPNWKGDILLVQCFLCGKDVRRDSYSQKNNKTGRFVCENKECQSKFRSIVALENPNSFWLSGEDHPGWKHGKAYEPYPENWRESFKENIRDRDSRVCQLCNKKEKDNKRRLPVHHINYNKKDLDPFNLICLCNSCHSKTNSHRQLFENMFTIMMEIK